MEPPINGQSSIKALRVLELYAGIGGMHCALDRCFSFSSVDSVKSIVYDDFEVVAAIDVNEVAAAVYRHNFPATEYLLKGVEGLTLADLEALNVDLVTMSPPCQPFTRQGLKKDEEDPRTKSFFHFLSLMERMAERGTGPNYVLVENVFGFETSATHRTLIEMLEKCGFARREFLLTPSQFGIPNSRLRYFLIGWKFGNPSVAVNLPSDLMTELPSEVSACRHHGCIGDGTTRRVGGDSSEPSRKRLKGSDDDKVTAVSYFLDDLNPPEEQDWLLPDKVLKRFLVMDVTRPDSRRSCCFTKAYGHYVDGTGSFLQLNDSGITRDSVFAEIKKSHGIVSSEEGGDFKTDSLTEDDFLLLRNLKLRYFTPSEIAKLHCLSKDFEFPDSITRKQRWKVLGNGLNAHVVAVLMRLLLTPS